MLMLTLLFTFKQPVVNKLQSRSDSKHVVITKFRPIRSLVLTKIDEFYYEVREQFFKFRNCDIQTENI